MESFYNWQSKEVLETLSQVNTDVITAYLGRSILPADLYNIRNTYLTPQCAVKQAYKLFYANTLLGVVNYGYVPKVLNCVHSVAIDVNLVKEVNGAVFKATFTTVWKLS